MGNRRAMASSFLGLTLAFSYTYSITTVPCTAQVAFAPAVFYLAIAFALLAFAVFIESNKLTARITVASDILAGLCMAAGAPLALFGFGAPFAVAGSVAAGAGSAWAYMRLSSVFAGFDTKAGTAGIFLAAAASALLKGLFDFMPVTADAALLAVIALALAVCLRLSDGMQAAPGNEQGRFYNMRTITPLWHLVAGIAVFSLALGILRTTLLAAPSSCVGAGALVCHGSEAVLAVIMIAWSIVLGRGLNFSRNWRPVLLLMLAALILAPDLPDPYADLLLALVRTAQTFLIVFLLLALVDIARHSVFNAMVVFALGWISYALPQAAGMVAGACFPLLPDQMPIALPLIAMLLVFCTLFLFDEASVGNHILFSDLNDPDAESSAARLASIQASLGAGGGDGHVEGDRIDVKCARLRDAHGLTPREHEILALLAHGRTKSYIADAFIISENTVRGHVKRLYAKLDVHSRQELLDLVERTEF